MEISNLFKHTDYVDSEIEELLPISSSAHSEYIPLFAGNTGKILTLGDKKILRYGLFIRQNIDDSLYQYKPNRFLYGISHWFNGVVQFNNGKKYYFVKHCVYYFPDDDLNKQPVILWTLAVKSEYFFNIDTNKPDLSKFVLLVNNKIMNPEHRVVKLKFNAYLKEVEALNIDVMYTNNINARCLVDTYVPPKFKSVSDMQATLKSTKDNLMSLFDPDSQFTFKEIKPLANVLDESVVVPIEPVRFEPIIMETDYDNDNQDTIRINPTVVDTSTNYVSLNDQAASVTIRYNTTTNNSVDLNTIYNTIMEGPY